jgi:predicted permease
LFDKHAYRKNLYKYALVFGNFGFLGNAVVQLMFGEETLFQYQMFTLPLQAAVYAWGLPILIPRGEQRKNPLCNLLNPPLVGLVIGVVLGLTGARAVMPTFLSDALSGLGSCMGPVAMVMTGFVVGGYNTKTLFANKKVYALSVLRLLVLPTLLTALVLALGAPPQTAVFCLLAYAAPMGLNTVVFPAAYGEDTSVGASMALVSHIAGVVTLPLLYTLLKTMI